jgi:ribonuclease D
MAMQLHPDIYKFDSELQEASQILANATPDFIEEEKAAQEQAPADIINDELFAKLKSWRFKRATSESKAAFIVAHDSTLKAIAARPPATRQQLMAIPGMGPKKIDTYGDDILKITQEYTSDSAASEPTANNSNEWSDYDETTLRMLLKDHAPLTEVCNKLGREPEDVWAHIAMLL